MTLGAMQPAAMNSSPPQLVRPTLRQRQIAAVRHDILQAAIKRFQANGYDETTVDEIADDIGVSRRTVFRYFPTKDDMVLSWGFAVFDGLRAAVAARPPDEPPLACMHAVMIEHVAVPAEAYPDALMLAALIKKTPRLRARSHEITDAWEAALTEGLIARDPDQSAQAPLVAAVAVAVGRLGARRWLDSDGGTTLTASLDRAFDELAKIGL
ncbi:MAG: TetR family transcriptional regulator [Aurantimonas endophytica]|uniref:TetR family transcriptional regulator n=1 Tax=Aurantimonas endophytica TaxID=1522175 RepID=UPI00300279CA